MCVCAVVCRLCIDSSLSLSLSLSLSYTGIKEGNISHLSFSLDNILYGRPAPGYAHHRTPLDQLYSAGVCVCVCVLQVYICVFVSMLIHMHTSLPHPLSSLYKARPTTPAAESRAWQGGTQPGQFSTTKASPSLAHRVCAPECTNYQCTLLLHCLFIIKLKGEEKDGPLHIQGVAIKNGSVYTKTLFLAFIHPVPFFTQCMSRGENLCGSVRRD
jgi:hypothetical protein